jgi:hypothetical protein
MSHISGEYTYQFTRIEPFWCDSAETGVEKLVVGLTCTFSGVDSHENEVNVANYVDGTTGFMPYIDKTTLDSNISNYCNDYATANDWWANLKNQVSGRIDHPVTMTGFNPTVNPNPPA